METKKIKCVPTDIAAALRSIMMNLVCCHAIELVKVIKNTSVSCNEFLSDRLSLCPITCVNECRGSIHVHNNTEDMLDVLAKSIVFDDKHAKVVYKDLIICRLAKGQTFHAEFTVRRGNGTTHAKYSPISVCFFDNEYENGNVDLIFETIGNLPAIDVLDQSVSIFKKELYKIRDTLTKC